MYGEVGAVLIDSTDLRDIAALNKAISDQAELSPHAAFTSLCSPSVGQSVKSVKNVSGCQFTTRHTQYHHLYTNHLTTVCVCVSRSTTTPLTKRHFNVILRGQLTTGNVSVVVTAQWEYNL